MKPRTRAWWGFLTGSIIGTLGGMIGLGGAEFRLPVLVSLFRLPSLEAVIMNKAVSLVLVIAAIVFRTDAIPFDKLYPHINVVLNLLAGSLIGAWWAAGHAMTMSRQKLNQIIMILLIALALLMLAHAFYGFNNDAVPLLQAGPIRFIAGLGAGLGIGMVAAFLGVAGGELLIPTIVLLYGLDIKLAGSLSLVVSLPTMIVAFARYRSANAFAVLTHERILFRWMVAGSILGAGIGGLLLGVLPARLLVSILSFMLLISALKIYHHTR